MPQERWWLLHIGWTWQCFILVKSIVILVASPLSLVKTQELCQLLIVLARRSTSFTEQSAPLKPIKQVQCPVTLLQSPDRLYHSGRVLKSSFHVSAPLIMGYLHIRCDAGLFLCESISGAFQRLVTNGSRCSTYQYLQDLQCFKFGSQDAPHISESMMVRSILSKIPQNTPGNVLNPPPPLQFPGHRSNSPGGRDTHWGPWRLDISRGGLDHCSFLYRNKAL